MNRLENDALDTDFLLKYEEAIRSLAG